MKQEKEEGREITVLRDGRVLRLTPMSRLAEALSIDLPGKLLLCLLVLAALVAGATWAAQAAALHPSLAAAGALVSILLLWALLRRWIIEPIDELIHHANRIAACDLTHVVQRDRKDRFGELQAALGQMGVNVMSIVRDARERSLRMCRNMQDMSRDNAELADRARTQSDNLSQRSRSRRQHPEGKRHGG